MPNKNFSRILLAFSMFLFLCLACSRAFAVFRGEPDAGEHPYAGLAYIFIPASNNYTTCSGSLVNAPNLPDRQVFLTAGHCIFFAEVLGGGTRWNVTFDETPEMDFADPTSRFPTTLSPDHTYAGTCYTDFSTKSMVVGLGVEKGITALSSLIAQSKKTLFTTCGTSDNWPGGIIRPTWYGG